MMQEKERIEKERKIREGENRKAVTQSEIRKTRGQKNWDKLFDQCTKITHPSTMRHIYTSSTKIVRYQKYPI
ncbi:hypothetical protein PRUPE_5G037700 [Prunus persica]|uniref:Uncharacterized protein n=1 Tax=Prunus persica TaxID=3760 RepID=A0A251P3E2_PRUPE|nr:hypothetical protein PRUPE_5G037700 [Prunus persica]